jgi:hypothetical protein
MEKLPKVLKFFVVLAAWLAVTVALLVAYHLFNPTKPEQPKVGDRGCVYCKSWDKNNNV